MNEIIEELQGRTIIGLNIDPEENEITMTREDGSAVKFLHHQSCCENVTIEDVNGDWNDLLNVRLDVAEVRSFARETSVYGDSETFTFYTFRTIKGSVDVRWHGTSNGYYSERVDMVIIPAPSAE